MREIKFRAWDNKKMWTVYKLDFGQLANTPVIGLAQHDAEDIKETIWGTKVVLMQYTGLKDKNDKAEVYESDLLRNEAGEVFKVEWSNGQYWCVREKGGNTVVSMFEPFPLTGDIIEREGFEVIGNIYENPDLLGGK